MSTQANKSFAKSNSSRGSNIRYYEITDEFSHRMAQVVGLLRKHSLNLGWFDGKLPIKLHNLYFSIQDGDWRPGTPATIWEDIAASLRTLDSKFTWKAPFQSKQTAGIEDKLSEVLNRLGSLEANVSKLVSAAGLPEAIQFRIMPMLKTEQFMGKFTATPLKVRVSFLNDSVDAPLLRENVKKVLSKNYPNTAWQFEDEVNLPGLNWESASQIDIVL